MAGLASCVLSVSPVNRSYEVSRTRDRDGGASSHDSLWSDLALGIPLCLKERKYWRHNAIIFGSFRTSEFLVFDMARIDILPLKIRFCVINVSIWLSVLSSAGRAKVMYYPFYWPNDDFCLMFFIQDVFRYPDGEDDCCQPSFYQVHQTKYWKGIDILPVSYTTLPCSNRSWR